MTGLTWRETMRGAVGERPASFEIEVTAADVRAFVAEPSHTASATGTVHVDGLTEPGGARIDGGTFQLLVEVGDPRARAMLYTLPFEAGGQRWTLRGEKDVRGRTPAELWRAATSLATTIEGGEGPPERGTLGLGARDVARLGASMRGRRRARFLWFFTRTMAGLLAAGRRARPRPAA